jgi:hypothetical protein
MMSGAAIKVEGLEKTLNALKVIDPEAMKAMKRGFKDAAAPIVSKAQGRVPDRPFSNYGRWRAWASGRDLSWDASKVRRGIRTQISVRKSGAALSLVNASVPGAVWENAGSQGGLKSTRADRVNQARAFNMLANGQGEAPRLLVRTWKEEKGIRTTYVAVGKLIADAEKRVQKALG